MKFWRPTAFLLALVILGSLTFAAADLAAAPPLPGAIFTTNAQGTRVNQNFFANKCDVYLDGGPGPNAPIGAAGLPNGDYYFQVTDPSGKTLLSTDPVQNRKFHVSGGIITALAAPGNHNTGVDVDHGALTIQLCQFNDTPNNGGVYKAWVTPVGDFNGDPTKVDNNCSHGCFHGFIAASSKTDNFKVKGPAQPGGACLTLNKVLNGTWIAGWPITIYDPIGTVIQGPIFSYLTKDCIAFNLVPGTYVVVEDLNGSTPTATRVDGSFLSSPTASVTLKIKVGDTNQHEIVYYNSK